MKKIIIVGAGTSGLYCGALLSKDGYQVEIYERAPVYGGRAMCIKKDGFVLDWGLHLIKNGEKGFISKIFSETGETLDIIHLKEPEVLYYENKKFYEYPDSTKKFLQSNIVDDNDKNTILSSIVEPDIVEKNFGKSVERWIDEKKGSEKLKNFMRLTCFGIICPFIEKADAGELFDIIKRRVSLNSPKTGYPYGGFETIHKKLVNIIKDAGGSIITQKEVKNILIEKNKVVGINVDGEKKHCDILICAILPSDIIKILDREKILEDKINFLKNIIPTSGISIDWCLREKITDMESLIISVEDINLFGIAISNIDKSIAPDGKQLITFTTLNYDKNQENRKETLIKLEQKVEEIFPKIKNYVEYKRVLYLPVIDGVELNINQYRKKRPAPSFLGIEGLYICGDYLCGEGAGGDLAVTSAKLCVDEIKCQKLSKN